LFIFPTFGLILIGGIYNPDLGSVPMANATFWHENGKNN